MIQTIVAVVLILFGYVSSYVVSLYALAVYIDPEEVESLFSETSRRRKRLLKKLAADPRAFMQIAAVYQSFSLIVITGLSIYLLLGLASLLRASAYLIVPCGLMAVWLLTVTIVDLLPRRVSRKAISRKMLRHLWLVSVLYRLLSPIVLAYRRALMVRRDNDSVTEEEKEEIVERAIETLAEQAGISETIVEEDEKEMIGHIFLLDQTIVREIMSPRIDITGVERGTRFAEIQETVQRDGHSRFPVYDGSIDRIIGILYVKDLFNNMPRPGEEFVIGKYLRKPFFVPETKIIGDLLREFRARQLHIAVVVDEYGGVSGLVTLEDILEEIVGEIQDEHDSEEAVFVRLSEGHYLVDASMLVDELQHRLGTDFEQGEYDTVGGLVYDLVGSVPDEGARVIWQNLELTVTKCEGQRIRQVSVRVLR
ncbi:MAG: HlyC/CorC family transporter [Candidatus Zixiibacteriota bacterium]|nr:MAG: HlyC/CorC family transporter [candidate division Zixibacteria bacterium]